MTPDRLTAIADYVRMQGEARLDALAEHFGVSRMTIHRDIDKLAQQGVLRKLHGAVTAQPSSVYESLYAYRSQADMATKAALAHAAMAEVMPGQAVLLDDSTTVAALAPMIADAAPLTVATNSLGLMQELAHRDEIALIAIGGNYAPTYNAFIGPDCEAALGRIRVNLALVSASGVADGVALVQDAQVTRAKAAMLAAAERRVLVLGSGKFGRIALNKLARLDAFDAVYTDTGLPASRARALRDTGVPLNLVDLS